VPQTEIKFPEINTGGINNNIINNKSFTSEKIPPFSYSLSNSVMRQHPGSLPCFRTITKGSPSRKETGAPMRNPLASSAQIISGFKSEINKQKASITLRNGNHFLQVMASV
jgi:hypothetical protein